MNLNKVILIGRLTRDPESKALPSGQSVSSFGLATDRFYYSKDGQKQQQTEFHNIVSFGKLADLAAQYLKKGSLVFIEGRLQTRSWKDASGNQKWKTEVITERMQLGPKSATKREDFSQPSPEKEEPPTENIPIIEEEKEIDVKDIPF